jgi:hypothetical protein
MGYERHKINMNKEKYIKPSTNYVYQREVILTWVSGEGPEIYLIVLQNEKF